MQSAHVRRAGVIPSGSTDATAFTVHGTNDAVTAALHCALGESIGLDVAAVFNGRAAPRNAHAPGAFLRYAINTISFGFLGDVIDKSETLRWLGARTRPLPSAPLARTRPHMSACPLVKSSPGLFLRPRPHSSVSLVFSALVAATVSLSLSLSLCAPLVCRLPSLSPGVAPHYRSAHASRASRPRRSRRPIVSSIELETYRKGLSCTPHILTFAVPLHPVSCRLVSSPLVS